jgi:hypothetical protein
MNSNTLFVNTRLVYIITLIAVTRLASKVLAHSISQTHILHLLTSKVHFNI